ncbi:hypothetical protein GP486_007528 [Trichoglossum hirsutum]|uniref:Uncharacterized protein n=1 Tax=Trichoglossum hirsutum TaxID=265104 RepID=A0A9P8IJE5_9PEZI|nr:hypothetical protein GP486_007528 [Trichoglossum hirsutum]
MLAMRYILRMNKEVWYPLLWTVLGVLAAGTVTFISTFFPEQLKIGTVAPVDPHSIYVPRIPSDLNDPSFDLTNARIYALQVPSALRAVGAVGAISPNSVVMEQVGASPNITINYNYNVTATDFGLLHAPGLVLKVNGSCATEYGWFDLTEALRANGTITSVTDVYYLWNNKSIQLNASSLDGGPPFPFIHNPGPPGDGLGNSTYSIVPSSVWRYSFTAGTDPWYETRNSSEFYTNPPFPYIVRSRRPALSCWETNIWSFRGNSEDVWNLDKLSGLDLPAVLFDVFKTFLGTPVIAQVGIRLGRSGLASSASAHGAAFNANSSSIHDDIRRLVNASYVSTKNLLVETTRFSLEGRENIPNLVKNGTKIRPGAANFVVSSTEIITLSVRTLIIAPTALGGVVLLSFIIGKLPFPWRMTDALSATVLYSYIDPKTNQDWKRKSIYVHNSNTDTTGIKPAYEKDSGLQWS